MNINISQITDFLKKYWFYLLTGIVIIALYFNFRMANNAILKEVKSINDSHQVEIDSIRSALEEEKKQHDANIAKLQQSLDEVQKQYVAASAALSDKKKQEIIDIMTKYGKDPTALAKKLSEATGFQIVLPQE